MAADPDTRNPDGRRSPADRSPAKYLLVLGLLGAAVLAAGMATAATSVSTIPGLSEPDPLVRFGVPIVRVLLDLSAVATVGLSILPRLLDPSRPKLAEPILAVSRRATVAVALTWLICALLVLVLQAAELQPGNAVSPVALTRYLHSGPAAGGLMASAGAASGCVLLAMLAIRRGASVPAELRALPAVLGLLPLPLTGHATGWDLHAIGMLALELHVIAAALWTGGLLAVALFVAPRRGLLATTLPRFSMLATAAIGIVAISGLINGVLDIGRTGAGLTAVVSTGYGWIILAKLGCLAVVATLAGQIRFRLLPRVVRHRRTALIGWLALEASVLGLAYGLGAVLARAPVVT